MSERGLLVAALCCFLIAGLGFDLLLYGLGAL